jgi:hypothetical protein
MQTTSKQKKTSAKAAEASKDMRQPNMVQVPPYVSQELANVLTELISWTQFRKLHKLIYNMLWELIISKEEPLPSWSKEEKEELYMLLQILDKLSKF